MQVRTGLSFFVIFFCEGPQGNGRIVPLRRYGTPDAMVLPYRSRDARYTNRLLSETTVPSPHRQPVFAVFYRGHLPGVPVPHFVSIASLKTTLP